MSHPNKLITLALIIVTISVLVLLRNAALDSPRGISTSTFSKTHTDPKIEIDEARERHFTMYRQGSQDGYILRIPIHGLLIHTADESFGFSGLTSQMTTVTEVKKLLDYAAGTPSIKGVLLDVDSPGGTVVAASAMAEEIEKYKRNTGFPVLAHVSGMAASGSYWVAVAADRVVAHQGTMIGSIGVILGPFKYYKQVTSEGGLLDSVVTKDGIETYTVTAGTYKDTFSPYRKITDEELAHYQNMVNANYEDFVNHVSESRKISTSQLKSQVKALVYDEKTALKHQLIDEVGSLDQALALMGWSDLSIVSDSPISGFLDTLFGFNVRSLIERQVTSPQVRVCSMCKQPLAFFGDLAELY